MATPDTAQGAAPHGRSGGRAHERSAGRTLSMGEFTAIVGAISLARNVPSAGNAQLENCGTVRMASLSVKNENKFCKVNLAIYIFC